MRRKWMWWLSLPVVLVLLVATMLSCIGLSDRVPFADVVIVPGNTVYPDGRLSARLQGRLDAALAVYRAGRCRVIFVSGATGVEGVDEAQAMRRYLVAQDVPADRVIVDSAGYNTEATARNAAAVMRVRGYRSALAVSQFFHIVRTRALLERHGVKVVGHAHADYYEWRDAYSLLREVAAVTMMAVMPQTAG